MVASTAVGKRSTLRVLGVDPGSRVTGFGVIEFDKRSFRHLASGRIRIGDQPFATRLHLIYKELGQVIRAHRPHVMAVEKVFVANNAQSALTLGQARGAAIVAGTSEGLEVVEYTALQVKQAVVGTGRADKVQVQHMVRMLLGLREMPPHDAADALACGICHVHTWDNTRRIDAGLRNAGAAP